MQGLFVFGSTLSGTFLTLYLWRLTNSLWMNGLFYIFVYFASAVAFVVGGKLVKQKGLLPTYRIGIALTAIFYLSVVISGKFVVTLYPLFAVFLGIATGFYWVGLWTLHYAVSNERNRLRFLGLNSLTSTAATLAAPVSAAIIFSWAEGVKGYIIIFSIATVAFIFTAVMSVQLRITETRRKTYYLRHMIPLIRRNSSWGKAVAGNLLLGFKQGSLLLLPTILLYQVLQGENKVGLLNAVLSMLSILASYLFSRYASAGATRLNLIVTITLYLVGACLLITGISVWTVVSFMVVHYVCNPIKMGAIDGYYF